MTSGDSVPADVFIRVAEERKFVGEITRLMMDRVIDELGPLLYSPDFRVTVNISSQDLLDSQFFEHVERSTAWTGIPPSALAFELTEHSTADQATAAGAIARLRASGHAIYIDDFGTGYSSLAYLHDLHVDAIKIDRAFTKTVGTEAVTASVVPQILAMADQLGLTVIVEGIETAEQAEYFRQARTGMMGQGWYFGRPVPAQEFIARMRAEHPAKRVSKGASQGAS
jgi:sensor c-di-GMP phosphodiesterase-like protein